MKTIAFCNQKGGVGKTSSAISLASFVALSGCKTLLIDLDPQGNATSGLGVEKAQITQSAYDVLLKQIDPKDILVDTIVDNLQLLPCNINLTGAEVELVNEMGRESRLKKALEKLAQTTDIEYVFVDCPPSLGFLTINALTAANSVIIPIQCEYYALEGLGQLIKTVDLVRENLNPSLYVQGILMTMADGRTKLTDQVIKEVKKHFANQVYDTIIPRSVKMSEAPGFGKPIMLYDKDSTVCKRYKEFASEFLVKTS